MALPHALRSYGADVNARDNEGRTVLMYQMFIHESERELYDDVFQSLIKAGADVNAKDNQGRTIQDWIKLKEE